MPINSHNSISRSTQCYSCSSIWLSSKPWNNQTSKQNTIRNTHSIWASGILQRNIPRCISSLRSGMARWPHAQNQNTLAWLHSQAAWVVSIQQKLRSKVQHNNIRRLHYQSWSPARKRARAYSFPSIHSRYSHERAANNIYVRWRLSEFKSLRCPGQLLVFFSFLLIKKTLWTLTNLIL